MIFRLFLNMSTLSYMWKIIEDNFRFDRLWWWINNSLDTSDNWYCFLWSYKRQQTIRSIRRIQWAWWQCTIDATIEISTHKEEVEALANKIKKKFEIINEWQYTYLYDAYKEIRNFIIIDMFNTLHWIENKMLVLFVC